MISYRLKVPSCLLQRIRRDLRRPHFFAHERVGFMTAGAVQSGGLRVDLLAREYFPVADNDYEICHGAGASIGANAIRKGLQSAYKDKSSLIHIHTHGGTGVPGFSKVDLESGVKFVPSFFNLLPKMPHALAVMSNDAIRVLVWTTPESPPQTISEVVELGTNIKQYGVEA